MKYRLGIVQWCLPAAADDAVRVTHELGMNALNLDLGNANDGYRLSKPEVQKAVLADAARYDVALPVISLNCLGGSGFLQAADDPRTQTARRELQLGVQVAADMGVPGICIPHFGVNMPKTEEDDARTIDALAYACELGRSAGVHIYTENIWGAEKLRKLFAAPGCEDLLMLFDTQNYTLFAGLEALPILNEFFPRIGAFVHLKDGVHEPGDTLLGEGDCRFADSLAALLASPFEGAMILEGKYATFEDIGREIAALKKLMGE